jgi:putative spermidine/putrescine transport system permease protein
MTIRNRLASIVLLAPMVVFLVATLVIPVLLMVVASARDVEVAVALPRTLAALKSWQPAEPVPDEAYAALAEDLKVAGSSRGKAATRLNLDMPGALSLLSGSFRALDEQDGRDPKVVLIAHDARWAKPEIWRAIRDASGPWTDRFLLAAVDLKRDAQGKLGFVPGSLYQNIYLRTFTVAIMVTGFCLLLGVPVALYLASLSPRKAVPLLLVLMLPLWTSVLVRAMAWILLLQTSGLVNQTLMFLHLVTEPLRLVFNRAGVLIAMTHVLLPFMILPAYNSMRTVPRDQLRAAGSLGATPFTVFRKVYLPQCRSGIAAGCLLVFASASGYYITPALIGGGADQMLGTFVELAALRYSNQPLAAALGVVFLVIFLALVGAMALILRPGTALAERRARG